MRLILLGLNPRLQIGCQDFVDGLLLPAHAKLLEQVRHFINVFFCFSYCQLPFSELSHNILVGHGGGSRLLVVLFPALVIFPNLSGSHVCCLDFFQDRNGFLTRRG